ncbi:MAG: agmatine deiminase family protein [Bacteroidota bacterium]
MQKRMPAEWEPQDAIMLAWPHEATDWAPMLEEARDCFSRIIDAISKFQKVIVLINDPEEKFNPNHFSHPENILPIVVPFNDTWARDFGPLFIKEENRLILADFKFNGWGLKYAADKDNLITGYLFQKQYFSKPITYENHLDFVLEGGSLESDGQGTILTTGHCLLSPNRNGGYAQMQLEQELKSRLAATRILWIDHGHLIGDDTDSHIDTLARFCNTETIAYVKCTNPEDVHYPSLAAMEEQLKNLKKPDGHPYQLIPLPMADPVWENGQRLPATYANFLIINGAVLLPFYNSEKDEEAKNLLQSIFPDREIIGIDCRPLILQNGSLHCVTMQLPEGVLNNEAGSLVSEESAI